MNIGGLDFCWEIQDKIMNLWKSSGACYKKTLEIVFKLEIKKVEREKKKLKQKNPKNY